MPKKKTSRNAQGGGSIRQRSDGRWEARYTVGRDPGTGKQIQKSIYGATQKEVRQQLQKIVADLEITEKAQDFSCLKRLYSRVDIFGVDLYEFGLGEKIEKMASELFSGVVAVRKTLHKYVSLR